MEVSFSGSTSYKDPVGAKKPGMTFDDDYKALVAVRPQVTSTQRKLLENRYHLEPSSTPTPRCRAASPSSSARLPGYRKGLLRRDVFIAG
jgi:hypothetical protein